MSGPGTSRGRPLERKMQYSGGFLRVFARREGPMCENHEPSMILPLGRGDATASGRAWRRTFCSRMAILSRRDAISEIRHFRVPLYIVYIRISLFALRAFSGTRSGQVADFAILHSDHSCTPIISHTNHSSGDTQTLFLKHSLPENEAANG